MRNFHHHFHEATVGQEGRIRELQIVEPQLQSSQFTATFEAAQGDHKVLFGVTSRISQGRLCLDNVMILAQVLQ